jgi:hypothetical protein
VRTLIAFALAALVFAATAFAQQPLRTIPLDAKRGRMTHIQAMDVQLDGRPTRLAPGVIIRDAGNRIILPTTLPSDAPVGYLVDFQGQIDRVWILTPEEAARPARR